MELEAFTQLPGATDGQAGAENVETPNRHGENKYAVAGDESG